MAGQTTLTSLPLDGDAAARRAMVVSQLRPEGVTDARVLAAMGEIDRAAHVPERWRAAAYGDRSIPLPGGGAMMPPAALGRILTRMALPAAGTFRLVGEDGYAAALLSAMGLVAAGDDVPADVLLFTGAVRAIDEERGGPLAPGARAGGALQERGVSRLFTATRSAAGWSIDRFGDAAVEPLAGDRAEPGFIF